MAKKKSNEIENAVARACDCWLKIETCYCSLDCKATRYSVQDRAGRTHSRWDTINDALKDGRKRVGTPFVIWDDLEQRTLIHYE